MNAFYTRIERLPDGGFRGKGFWHFPDYTLVLLYPQILRV